jgi:parallel beta-helix repeat protein
MKYLMKVIFFILFISVIGAGFFFFLVPQISPAITNNSSVQLKPKTDSSIYIYTNNQLAYHASYGNGTSINPYIIENKVINGEGISPGIYIENTNAFFILRGCEIFNATYGIQFQNVTNGELRTNTVHHNVEGGIYLYSSNRSMLWGNRIYNTSSGTGIRLDSSEKCTLSNNTAYNNNYSGIWLKSLKHGTLSLNTVYSNKGPGGIYLLSSRNCTLSGNFGFNNDREGIYLLSSSNITLAANNLTSNSGGIYLEQSNNCSLFANLVHNNYRGIGLVEIKNCTLLKNNICQSQSDGIAIFYSTNCLLANNTVSYNGYYGIFLDYSNQSILSANTLHNNVVTGIQLDESSEISIINNNISLSRKGISIGFSNQINISNNTINNNAEYGIYLAIGVHYSTITWNILYENGQCIYIDPSGTNNSIENNDCRDKPEPIAGFTWILSIFVAALAVFLQVILRLKCLSRRSIFLGE